MKKSITVTIAGDWIPDMGGCQTDFAGQTSERIGEVKSIFDESDLTIVNLECPLTLNKEAIQKIGPCFKADPRSVRIAEYLGVDVFTLANNHIRDFGDAGVEETLETCVSKGIATVGAGANLAQARCIRFREVRDYTIAIINVAENEFANASPCRAGANPLDLISLLSDIDEAKRNAQFVILIIHGGLEYTHYPSPASITLLRFLAEQGIAAIVRHHPHYVQGIEVWKGVPIFYSLGNFWCKSNNLSRPGWFEGILTTLEFSTGTPCSYRVHPFHQCKTDDTVKLMHGQEKIDFDERLKEYSTTIASPEEHLKTWKNVLRERSSTYFGLLAMPNNFLFKVVRKLGLLSRIRPTMRKRLLWQNLLRCEAHREVLIEILKND